MTVEEAVKKLAIRDTKKGTALNRLAGYESGAEDPSRPILSRMSKQYRRPLLTFYLPKPPQKGDRGADFRTLAADALSPATSAVLDSLIRDMHERQSMVRAVLEDEEETNPLPFVGSRSVADGPSAVGDSLRELLDFRLADYRAQRGADAAFSFLRNRAENAGIFVLLKGDLGSYHTAIELEVFRGFTISDVIAPFIVINDRDTRAAWAFTLLHEMVHLILGQTGVSGQRAENEIEGFCNDVAGEFLLPGDEAREIGLREIGDLDDIAERMSEFANSRNLSRTMVAYRAFRVGTIGQSQYRELSERFREQWFQLRAAQRAPRRSKDGGPNYYVVRRHRLGERITSLVSRMMAGGKLSTSRAARILGVRPTQVQAILSGSGPS